MSEKIKQIIDVLYYIKSHYKGYDITTIRRDADKFVAIKYSINERTVVDKYRRQLKDKNGNDLGTQNFDYLLEKWLTKRDQELNNILLKYCSDKSDKLLVINFFGNDKLEIIEEPEPDTLEPHKRIQRSVDEELLELVIEELTHDGIKIFPNDFLCNEQTVDFFEVELPGILLYIDPLFKSIISSSRRFFKYQAKNPAEAKYIFYSHKIGLKKIIMPQNNFVIFKAVTDYERYCREIKYKAFEYFLEFTNNEHQSELLTQQVIRRLELRGV